MALESAADRLAMLQVAGEAVTLFEAPYSTTIYAIVDEGFIEVNGVECLRPRALVRTSDITNASANYTVVHGSSFSSASGDYTVIGIQPDGTGMTVLVLQDG